LWQKAHEVTLLVYRVTEAFPDREPFGIVKQEDFNRLADGCDTVGRLINALMTSLKQRLG
jgi:hypothetical protein